MRIEDNDSMKFNVAERVARELLDVSGRLDGLVRLVQREDADETFQAYRRATGTVMAALYFDLLGPIFNEHPSLTPPGLEEP